MDNEETIFQQAEEDTNALKRDNSVVRKTHTREKTKRSKGWSNAACDHKKKHLRRRRNALVDHPRVKDAETEIKRHSARVQTLTSKCQQQNRVKRRMSRRVCL